MPKKTSFFCFLKSPTIPRTCGAAGRGLRYEAEGLAAHLENEFRLRSVRVSNTPKSSAIPPSPALADPRCSAAEEYRLPSRRPSGVATVSSNRNGKRCGPSRRSRSGLSATDVTRLFRQPNADGLLFHQFPPRACLRAPMQHRSGRAIPYFHSACRTGRERPRPSPGRPKRLLCFLVGAGSRARTSRAGFRASVREPDEGRF